jgi:hypothetical protein
MNDQDSIFTYREKRDVALTVRLPASIIKKIKKMSRDYNYSQSRVIEEVVLKIWQNESKVKGKPREK